MTTILDKAPTTPEFSSAHATAIEGVRQDANIRRRSFRRQNAFREVPGEIEMLGLAKHYEKLLASPETKDSINEEHYQAYVGNQELQKKREEIIAGLPALEDANGEPTGVTVGERINVFGDENSLQCFDLGRVTQRGWNDADRLLNEFHEWTDTVDQDRYAIEHMPSTEENCSMYIRSSESLAEEGLVYLGRNRIVALVYDALHDETMVIAKRSEFIIDLRNTEPEAARKLMGVVADAMDFTTKLRDESTILKDTRDDEIEFNVALTDEVYKAVDLLIAERDEGVDPIYATLYGHRPKEEPKPFEGKWKHPGYETLGREWKRNRRATLAQAALVS